MKIETVEEFLARGGEVTKSESETSLDQLLYNEGLLNHQDAKIIKKSLNEALTNGLKEEFKAKE